jgi:hypothetical protein
MTDAHYYKQQLAQLGESESFRLKLTGDTGETHWLTVTPEAVRRIGGVLANDKTYDTQAIAQAAFDAADEIQARYDLGSEDVSLLALLINLTMSRLEKPDITVEQAIRDNWSEEPEVIDGWINGEEDDAEDRAQTEYILRAIGEAGRVAGG